MSVTRHEEAIDDGEWQAWRARAACRDMDTELFFPLGETGSALEQAAQAKAVCAGCPVRAECLDFAMVTNQPDGIFGGLTGAERRSLRRRRARERRQGAGDEASRRPDLGDSATG